MLTLEVQQKLIRETINSAVCIDNEYVAAYSGNTGDANYADSKQLYESFRDSGKCHLDIYTFTNMADYQRDKEKLLRNRDLVILDWELSNAAPKYEAALAVLDDVCQNDQIHFVDIYTQAENLSGIAHTIYSYFKLQLRDELQPHVDAITGLMAELFDSYEMDGFDAATVQGVAKDVLGDFIMNPSRREEIQKNFIDQIARTYSEAKGEGNVKKDMCMKFRPLLQANKNQFKDTLAFIRAYCICFLCESEKVSASGLMAKAVNPTTVLVNGTVVHVTSKNTINPDGLFTDLVNAVTDIPRHRSLLLSLLLKQVVGSNLASVGKALGKISEEALLKHCRSLEEAGIPEENVSNFVVSALTEQVLHSFHEGEMDFSFVDLMTLGAREKIQEYENAQILEFNSMLTFIPKTAIKAPFHQIKTGDVFELDRGITGKDGDKELNYPYILCITQTCDALRPEKVNQNLAFVLGELVDAAEGIGSAEKDHYSYFPDQKVVKWSKRFFTIYIADTKLPLADGDRSFTFHYIDGDFTATFIGTQKEAYTYRIINNVFSNAMRIGIDLPHQ